MKASVLKNDIVRIIAFATLFALGISDLSAAKDTASGTTAASTTEVKTEPSWWDWFLGLLLRECKVNCGGGVVDN